MGKKKDGKNKGGTGSDFFDYRYGVGEAKHMMDRYGVKGTSQSSLTTLVLLLILTIVLLTTSRKTLLQQ